MPETELAILESKRNHASWFPRPRLDVLATMWLGNHNDNFADNAYLVVRECIQRSTCDTRQTSFSRIGQIPIELRKWLRDTFDLQQEVCTSAITASSIFAQHPQVVGNMWNGLGLQWRRTTILPEPGRKRSNRKISQYLQQAADNMTDPSYPIHLEPPELLHELHGVRPFDFFILQDGTYLVPATRTVGLWTDMSADECSTNGLFSSTRTARQQNQAVRTGQLRKEGDSHADMTEPLGLCDNARDKVMAWNHSILLVLKDDAPTTGALADIWDKIEATIKEGKHHVVLVLQDPPCEKEKGKRTERFFADRQGVCFAWLPPGTIAFGHACGWANSKTTWHSQSHTWTMLDDECICPPTSVYKDCFVRHDHLMNQQPVRFLLFAACRADRERMTNVHATKLRELALILGGTGGNPQRGRGDPVWLFDNQTMSLRWEDQASCVNLNFTSPWQQCMWQPSRNLCTLALGNEAIPQKRFARTAQEAQQKLHALSKRVTPATTVPDGVCPQSLMSLLVALGTSTTDSRALTLTCVRATLQTTWRLSEIHKTWKIHHLQLLGLPLVGIGEIHLPDTVRCPLCEQEWRHLYRVHAHSQRQTKAHEALLEQLLITHTLRQAQHREDSPTAEKITADCQAAWRDTLDERRTTVGRPRVGHPTVQGWCLCLHPMCHPSSERPTNGGHGGWDTERTAE